MKRATTATGRSPQGASPHETLAFDKDFLRKLEYLDVVAKKILSGTLRADRQSPRKGVSAEFDDYRPYVPGDDFRHVDWHLFGRLDELFLKLYREEENLHLTLLLDTSTSMRWGEIDKLHYAMQVTAALGYIGMSNMDSVNVIPFGPGLRDGRWGLRGKSKIFPLFEFLTSVQPEGETDLVRSCKEFILRERRRGVVILLSDFYDVDGIEAGLKYLRYPKNDIFAIHVADRIEAEPNLRGDLRLVDSESGSAREINVTDGLLARYRQAFTQLGERVESFCRRREIGYARAWTSVPFDELVLMILRRGGVIR